GLDALAEHLEPVTAAHVGLVEDVDGALAGLGSGCHDGCAGRALDDAQLTRRRYRPSRVSPFSCSPVVMNSGTWIWAPVSSVAGLVPPVERSPCRPGSGCSTSSPMVPGSSQ